MTTIVGTWYQTYENRSGVWTLGSIDVVIPNAPDHPDWTKKVWVQLTWANVGNPLPPDQIDIAVDGLRGQLIANEDLPAWEHSIWLFTLPYNPLQETLHISGDIYVDELVVDTKCMAVPEPSSLLALAGSLLGLAGFAWKRRH